MENYSVSRDSRFRKRSNLIILIFFCGVTILLSVLFGYDGLFESLW
jgi:hypothetical protein